MRSPAAVAALAAGLACTGAAQAQSESALKAAVFSQPSQSQTKGPAILLAGAPLERPAGVARTSLDRAFADNRAQASVGFLCGLDERVASEGATGAFGSDPHGRFIGGRLSFSFR